MNPMSGQSRREFLQTTSSALAAGSFLANTSPQVEADQARPGVSTGHGIPSHQPLPLEGVHAYTDKLSVAAGETIRFHVSSTLPYQLEVCRLGLDMDSPHTDEVLHAWKVSEPVMQPIHPGSYIHVEKGLAADEPIEALTIECWVRLWDVWGRQGLVGQFDETHGGGFALLVDQDGAVEWYLGDGGAVQENGWHRGEKGVLAKVKPPGRRPPGQSRPTGRRDKWHHVAAVYDGRTKSLWVDGRRVQQWDWRGTVRPGTAPLRIGAIGRDGLADNFLDGDVAMPVFYKRALTEDEIRRRFETKALQTPTGDHVLACWPLSEEQGDRVADESGHDRHGRIINHATWMIGGPSFNVNVDRFADYDPAKDAARGHALRLASDDLVDCRWEPTFDYRLPKTAKSGMYVGRIRFELDGEPRLYHALFVGKKAVDAPRASIAFLCSTNTWKAYAGTPFARTWPSLKHSFGHSSANSSGDPPMGSFYWRHRAGQGTYYMGLRMPWPLAGPYTVYGGQYLGHLCYADRYTQTWLEREDIQYDTYGDLDLHLHPELLDGYKTLVIAGHSEYWSAEAYRGVERFLKAGGNVLALSGNTMFWRVSFNEDGSVMESRKVDTMGNQLEPTNRGEVWHSQDGHRGGMSRECGYPAWKLIGLEFITLSNTATKGHGGFRVLDSKHSLFNQPHRLDVSDGDELGLPSAGKPSMVVGHEGDARVSTIAKVTTAPPPPGAEFPSRDPDGIELLAEGVIDWTVGSGTVFDYFMRPIAGPKAQAAGVNLGAEMIYWQRPDGGKVFNVASICAGRGFVDDPKFGLLIKNVLHLFEGQSK